MKLNKMQIGYTVPPGIAIPDSKSVRDLSINVDNNAFSRYILTRTTFRIREQDNMMVLWTIFNP